MKTIFGSNLLIFQRLQHLKVIFPETYALIHPFARLPIGATMVARHLYMKANIITNKMPPHYSPTKADMNYLNKEFNIIANIVRYNKPLTIYQMIKLFNFPNHTPEHSQLTHIYTWMKSYNTLICHSFTDNLTLQKEYSIAYAEFPTYSPIL